MQILRSHFLWFYVTAIFLIAIQLSVNYQRRDLLEADSHATGSNIRPHIIYIFVHILKTTLIWIFPCTLLWVVLWILMMNTLSAITFVQSMLIILWLHAHNLPNNNYQNRIDEIVVDDIRILSTYWNVTVLCNYNFLILPVFILPVPNQNYWTDFGNPFVYGAAGNNGLCYYCFFRNPLVNSNCSKDKSILICEGQLYFYLPKKLIRKK